MTNKPMWEQENRELRKELGDTQVRANHLESECKRLETLRETYRKELATSGLDLQEAKQRIEELEEAYKAVTSTEHFPPGCGKHIITTKQIDAAWNYTGDDWDCGKTVETVLAELGIWWCEECDGSGEGGMRYDGSPVPVEENCPDCNGHGWVKK